uniref:SFRICE_018305 n=1 Tax=Spodoptera frugiperda TaxID=7108 RepID=A0A2H1VE71_SPOFR
MLVEACSAVLYGAVFLSLILIDFILGHGFVDMFQKIFCKIACFVKRSVREEAKNVTVLPENPISLPVLFMEILVLSLTIAFLNKYKQFRSKDRIDDLLHESKEALRQTNEFLEKWRLRRKKCQVPTDYSYLDEEPQEIKPLRLEVPILHMAIIDTLGTTRSQPERGDAGDTVNITDSTLLSVTSLLDDDLESIPDQPPSEEKIIDETKNIEFRNRTLWDVMEEDTNSLED